MGRGSLDCRLPLRATNQNLESMLLRRRRDERKIHSFKNVELLEVEQTKKKKKSPWHSHDIGESHWPGDGQKRGT